MQFRTFEIAHRHRSVRAVARRRLGLGTCLSGAAAALLLGALPAQAQDAAPALTLRAPQLVQPPVRFHPRPNEPMPQDLTILPAERFSTPPIVMPPSGIWVTSTPSFATGAFGAPAATPVADLTVSGGDVVVNEGTIAKSGDYQPGIETIATGTTSITVDGVSTDGRRSAGVHAYGYGDITIHAGTVETHGYRSDGIYANNNVGGNSGGIEITAGDVTTTGYASSGIRAAAYNGSTVITANSVKTSGYGADAIYGWSYYHDTTVNVHDVETSGTGGRGITAYSGGTTTVNVDNVTTTGAGLGTSLDAGAIKAVGAAVDVHAGTVSTSGDYSAGIYANSNFVHDNGQDDRHITVDAGTVTTTGFSSDGIDAINIAPGSLTSVTADKVSTSGDFSTGILAYAPAGDVVVHAGTVETHGANAPGIVAASFYGNVEVHADAVTTSGANSVGVYSYAGGKQLSGGTTNTVDVGSVKTSGDGSIGIQTISLGRQLDTSITAGSVETHGYGATGILAIADGPGSDIAINAGTVSTSGKYADGIDAVNYAIGGKVNVSVGNVTINGDLSAGIFSYASTGDVTIHAGSVETKGYLGFGISANTRYGDMSVDVGQVLTHGDSAFGIAVSGENVSVVAGKVATDGEGSTGISAGGANNVYVKADTVSVAGGLARGIDAEGTHVTVVAGDVSSNGATAIYAKGYTLDGTVDVTVNGAVHQGSSYAQAIYAAAGGSVAVHNNGTVETDKGGSTGIFAYAFAGSTTVDGTGSVTTHGDHSAGVVAVSYGGSVSVTQGSVSTGGRYSDGIYAIAATGGDTTVKVDNVHVGYNMSDGIYAFGHNVAIDAGKVDAHAYYGAQGIVGIGTGDVTIHAGEVTTTGLGSTAVAAQALGNASVTVGKVDTQDAFADGVLVRAGSADVTAGESIATHAYASAGIDVIAYAGNANIVNSGTISTGSMRSPGISAQAMGDVTITGGGNVSTEMNYSMGLRTRAIGGDIKIDLGDVSTRGDYAIGTYAVSYDGSISIKQNSAATEGKYAVGIYAAAVQAYSNGPSSISIDVGSVTTKGDGAMGIRTFANIPDTDVTIKAGSVTTSGEHAWGIDASTLSGNVNVDAKNVTTNGDFAIGIAASSYYGDVTVNAENVTVNGNGANAIDAVSRLGYGDVHVTAKNVTAGAYASAIYAGGHSVTLDLSGTINKSGTYAAIGAIAHGGGITIHNDATITTTNGDLPYGAVLGHGIFAQADGDVTIDGNGSISTEGTLSYGVAAYSIQGGAISISQKDITTSGNTSHGIVAVTSNRIGYAPTDGDGGITVDVGSIATTGNYSSGMLLSDNTKRGSVVVHVAGDVTTTGAFGEGVSLYSANQTAEAHLHGVSTQGYLSQAVHLNGHKDVLGFEGAMSTKGVLSTAIVAYAGNGGISITGKGPITTSGSYFSSGIRASSPGDITIAVDGLISTQGRGSNGIEVTERKRHSEVYPYDPPADEKADAKATVSGWPFPDPRDPETAATGSKISITASAIQTAGMNSDGIMVSTTTGDVDLHTGTVAVGGKGSIGIFAEGRNLTADTGNTSSAQATAIALQSYESAALTVHGKVQGGTNGVLLQGYDNRLTVTSGGSIAGGANGVVIDATPHVTPIVHYWGYAPESYIGDDEPQPLPPANPAPGTAKVSNAGTISAGTGYAITVTGGGAEVNNSGVVIGAVKFSSFADSFTNSGQFVATKDSDFGGGGDSFVNTGTFTVARPAGSQSIQAAGTGGIAVSLLNLARFQNSGLIELRNGTAGDVLTISGAYAGSGAARLGLDIASGGADKLVIGGAATGSTAILLNVTPEGAHLLGQPLALVQTGAGSAATAFVLANDQVGLVQYKLAFDAGSNSFGLTAQAGAPVYRMLKLQQGAQAIWNQSADAWSSHMAELRDTDLPGGRLWGQAYGQVQTRDETRAIGGSSYVLDYRQDYYGGQAGYDIGGGEGDTGSFVFGATAGYLSSNLSFRHAATRIRYDAANLGGYAAFRSGMFFANLLAQYDHYWIGVDDRGAGWSDDVSGDAYGAKAEIGARLGGDRFFAEPLASLAWQHTDIGSLSALGQTIDLDSGTGLAGSVGARFGGTFALKGGARAVVYAHGAYVHEFEGKSGLLFESGGVSEQVANLRPGDYGQAAIGVNISGNGPLSGFIEGNATFGASASGGGGRVGVRVRF